MTITAKIVADSVNPDGVRITTLQLRYPKIIHGEFLTHRVFSRNSSSSRAIPVERLIKDVLDDPIIPSYWGSNRPGMQAGGEISDPVEVDVKQWVLNPSPEEGRGDWNELPTYHTRKFERDAAWLDARDRCVETARAFTKAGYHKQIVNRLLEPWCHINTVVTSTEWDNFFKLRCHPDAQPEMQMLAETVRDAINASKPIQLGWSQWHLPYVEGVYGHIDNNIKSSVARCARVSYLTHDQKQTTVEEDLKLFERLTSADPKHLSPTEHQAQARENWPEARMNDPSDSSNFHSSWLQYRKLIEQG
jgi:hypothetical protein